MHTFSTNLQQPHAELVPQAHIPRHGQEAVWGQFSRLDGGGRQESEEGHRHLSAPRPLLDGLLSGL